MNFYLIWQTQSSFIFTLRMSWLNFLLIYKSFSHKKLRIGPSALLHCWSFWSWSAPLSICSAAFSARKIISDRKNNKYLVVRTCNQNGKIILFSSKLSQVHKITFINLWIVIYPLVTFWLLKLFLFSACILSNSAGFAFLPV